MDILYNKINKNTTVFYEFQKILQRQYYYIITDSNKCLNYTLDGEYPAKIVFDKEEDCEKFIRILENNNRFSGFKRQKYIIGISQFRGQKDFFVVKYIYETSNELPQIFYSQPMSGLSLEEIVSTRLEAQKEIEKNIRI